jgi:hypothetical protein
MEQVNLDTTDLKLRNIFCLFWDHCAGWNRVSFGIPQINYMIRTLRIRFSAVPLGPDLDAVTILLDEDEVAIGINKRICPPHSLRPGKDGFGMRFTESAGKRLQFVLLHELGHVFLHTGESDLWRQYDMEGAFGARWLEDSGVLVGPQGANSLLPTAVREAEADFFSLIALAPDKKLAEIEQRNDGKLPAEMVAWLLFCDESHASPDDEMVALAAYRIDLYEKFAKRFSKVSCTLQRAGTPFRNVQTTDNAYTRKLWKRYKGAGVVDDVAADHPRVRQVGNNNLMTPPFHFASAWDQLPRTWTQEEAAELG